MATTTTALQTATATKAAATPNRAGQGLRALLANYTPAIKAALPAVMTPERFVRIAQSALSANPMLQQATPASFFGALMTAAALGLEPNTPLSHCWLIPRNNRKLGVVEAQFQLGYKGLITLAYRSGQVASIQAEKVCERDEFDYEFGLNPKLHHKPATGDRGAPIYYYAVWKTKDGATGFAVMSIEDIKAHAKKFSDAVKMGRQSPWDSNFDEMAKKGLALDTPIPTPTGWKMMEDLEKGSIVFDMNGKQTKVVAVSEVKHLPCFKLTFSDGESIICDDEHRWVAAIGSSASRDIKQKGWQTLTVNELFDAKSSGKSVVVPVTPRMEFREGFSAREAWLVGYWLGNGSKRHANLCCSSEDSGFVMDSINASGFKVGAVRKDKRANSVTIGIVGGFKDFLDESGLLGDKHVPQNLMRGTVEERIAVVRGMMDSDGTIEKERGRAIYCSTDVELARQFCDIVRSLGEQAHCSAQVCRGFGKETICYRVEWKPSTFAPVSMPRKAARLKHRKLSSYRSVKSIEKIPSVPTKCIAVESESKTYLAGWNMVPTHNTVLKQALKYAPLASDFVRGVASDNSIRDYQKGVDALDSQSKTNEDGEVIDLPVEAANGSESGDKA